MGFLIFSTTFLTAMYCYIGWRIIPTLNIGAGSKTFLFLVLILFSLLIPVSFYIRMNFPIQKWHDNLAWISYLSFGFFSLLAAIIFLKDLGLFTTGLLEKKVFLDRSILPIDVGRRNFLFNSLNATAVGIATLGGAYGYVKARKYFVIERVFVKIKNLHPDLEGFKIAQISDIHIGPTIKNDIMQKITNKVNELDVDMVAITGDIVDGPVSHLAEDIKPIADLKSRYGSYYINGNHEYYSGVNQWMKKFRELGLNVLLNEHKIIQHKKAKLLVGGVTDLQAGKFIKSHTSDPHKAMSGAPQNDFRLLLAHQPRSIYEAQKAGFDLQLSGHTHGGQYFPGNVLIYLFQPFVRGLGFYKNMQIYVNRGTGYWGPPMRIGSDPEITLLELVKA